LHIFYTFKYHFLDFSSFFLYPNIFSAFPVLFSTVSPKMTIDNPCGGGGGTVHLYAGCEEAAGGLLTFQLFWPSLIEIKVLQAGCTS
jgi:hypothetical protein